MSVRAVVAALAGVLVAGGVVTAAVTQEDAAPTVAAASLDTSTLPVTPPVRVCGNAALLDGPATPPEGAIVVPAGDNSSWTAPWNNPTFSTPGATYWFAPGLHRIGEDQYSQIKPGKGSTFLGAPGAILGGQNINRFAFGSLPDGTSENVTVKHLEIRYFPAPDQQGLVNNAFEPGWTVSNNWIHDNGGASIMGSDNGLISENCLENGSQYAINGCCDVDGLSIVRNEITGNTPGDDPGCGCSGGMKFWENKNLLLKDNWIHHNGGAGVWADHNNAGLLIEGNLIEHNDDEGIFYEQSYNAVIRNNVLRDNMWVKGFNHRNDNFPMGALYISESGFDPRVPDQVPGQVDFRVENNLLENNWGGVVLWEAADRYCSSTDGPTGNCTLVNPGVVTAEKCSSVFGADGSNKVEPYFHDCRWSVRNVNITNNKFTMDPTKIPNYSAQASGRTAIISNSGGAGPSSPYKDMTVGEWIAFEQNNHWSNNEYVGPWQFLTVLQGYAKVSWDDWTGGNVLVDWRDGRKRWFEQDQGSTLNAQPAPTTTVPPPTTTSGTTVAPPTTTTTNTTSGTVPPPTSTLPPTTTTVTPVPAVRLVCPVVKDPVATQKITCTFRK